MKKILHFSHLISFWNKKILNNSKHRIQVYKEKIVILFITDLPHLYLYTSEYDVPTFFKNKVCLFLFKLEIFHFSIR